MSRCRNIIKYLDEYHENELECLFNSSDDKEGCLCWWRCKILPAEPEVGIPQEYIEIDRDVCVECIENSIGHYEDIDVGFLWDIIDDEETYSKFLDILREDVECLEK